MATNDPKPPRDHFPYTATWNSLSPKQQHDVARRANKAKVAIPAILESDLKKQRQGK